MELSRTHVVARWGILTSLLWGIPLSGQAQEVGWEDQTERLQMVSAALLDGLPMGEPQSLNRGVVGKANISFLPKVSPKVGQKSEKVPSSPVHTIPTLMGFTYLPPMGRLLLELQGWAGYLPSGTESLFGIKAKLHQYAVGAEVNFHFSVGGFHAYVPLGVQYSNAQIKGAITGTDADDQFDTATTAIFSGLGGVHAPLNLWFNVTGGMRINDSRFQIHKDDTDLSLTDNLSDSTLPFWWQGAVGWNHSSGIRVGVSELFVPKRLFMPRLMMGLAIPF